MIASKREGGESEDVDAPRWTEAAEEGLDLEATVEVDPQEETATLETMAASATRVL